MSKLKALKVYGSSYIKPGEYVYEGTQTWYRTTF